MTGMLASVNSLEETRLILNTSVDIIDLKQPELGALGALSTELVKQIVQEVNHQKPVSATVGDLPMQPELISNAVSSMADTGVNYIKIGFFPGGDWPGTLSKLNRITQKGHQLIAVLFADTQPDISIIKSLKNTGFTGVMLDTMDKSKGSLPQIMSASEIHDFVSTSKDADLLCGLAGSLKKNDIPELLNLEVDYLGFRGALCEQHNRTAKLDYDSINSILHYFNNETAVV
jgi:uncharacterized protein (UPF0264 family)